MSGETEKVVVKDPKASFASFLTEASDANFHDKGICNNNKTDSIDGLEAFRGDAKTVYKWLLDYPELFKERFSIDGGKTKHLPILFLLRAKPELHHVAIHLECDYETIDEMDNHENEDDKNCGWYHLLEASIRFGCNAAIVSFLVYWYTGNDDVFSDWLADYDGEWWELFEGYTFQDAIELLVDNLGQYKLVRGTKEYKNYTQCFQLLYKNFPPRKDTEQTHWEDPDDWKLNLRSLLKNPETPSDLLAWLGELQSEYDECCCIGFSPGEEVVPEPNLIRNLQHFVPTLKCDKLLLYGGYFQNFSFIDTLFSQINFPPDMRLVLGTELASDAHFTLEEANTENWSSCQLQDLSISLINLHSEDFQFMLRSFQALPHLNWLAFRIESSQGMNCVNDVIKFLVETGVSLQRLKLFGPGFENVVNSKDLSAALKIASDYTWTLVHYKTDFDDDDDDEIMFQSAINRHGRVLAASSASVNILVECLILLQKFEIYSDMLEQSIVYGLLQQEPGIWATTEDDVVKGAAQKKRTACDPLEQPNTKNMK